MPSERGALLLDTGVYIKERWKIVSVVAVLSVLVCLLGLFCLVHVCDADSEELGLE